MTKAKPDYLDFDSDGNTRESMKKALKDKKTKSVKEGLIGGQTKIDVAAPYGKLTSADFKHLRKSKKKLTKEGYSNWREDLIEIADKIPVKKGKEEKITEKEVNNKIKINPKLELGEALENLGGTLLEMVEIDEVDYIVESVYNELLDEGYDDDEIEEALEYALVEAKVTFGHDTPTGQKKKGNLLKAVGRLARQKLSSKVRGVKSAAVGAVVRGARRLERASGEFARKMEGDDNVANPRSKGAKPISAAKRPPSAAGQRERVSSGSYTPPSTPKPKPKASSQKSPDPWEGSYKKSSNVKSKPQAKTTTVAPKPLTKEQQQAVVRAQRRNPNLSKSDAERIASTTPSKEERQREMRARMAAASSKRGLDESHYSLDTRKVEPGEPGEAHKKAIETLAATARTKKKTRKPVGTSRRGGVFKPSSREEAQANQASWDDYWSSAAKGYKEEYELLEKAESEQQRKLFGLALSVKRGQTSRDKVSDKVLEIVDSMSEKKIRDFAKTPHKGLPNKIETKEEAIRQEFIARMVEKIEEQSEVYVDEAKLPSSMKKGKKKLESKTQVIHDVDDNLADGRHPDAAMIDVMRKKSGKWEKVKSLTPSQFAHHKLRGPGEPIKEEKDDPGDKYGFDQFRSTKKFKETTKPNKPVVRLGDSSRRPAQKSVVTARGGSEFGSKKPSTPMDKPGEFAKDLKSRIGVKNLERKNVHFTGGMRAGSGPEKKAEVVKKIVKPDVKKVITTDDHLQNVRHMAAAASETAPKAKVRAYQSKPATKAKGKVKAGDIVPVRVGKEKNLSDTNIGIRKNASPSSSTRETQRRRKTARRGMGEAVDVNAQQQNTSQVNQPTSNELSPKQKSALSKLVQSKTMQLVAAKRAVSSGVSPDIS
jgi:hypothetical protein